MSKNGSDDLDVLGVIDGDPGRGAIAKPVWIERDAELRTCPSLDVIADSLLT